MKHYAKSKFEIEVIRLVKEMRTKKKFTQIDIANIIGKSRVFISQIENPNHKSKYNLDHLNRIAFHLDCSPADFIPKIAIEEDWD